MSWALQLIFKPFKNFFFFKIVFGSLKLWCIILRNNFCNNKGLSCQLYCVASKIQPCNYSFMQRMSANKRSLKKPNKILNVELIWPLHTKKKKNIISFLEFHRNTSFRCWISSDKGRVMGLKCWSDISLWCSCLWLKTYISIPCYLLISTKKKKKVW